MSLIHIYIDKDDQSNNKFIDILKEQHIDFLQYNIKNKERELNKYNLESLPAIKFKDSLTYDINEDSINETIENFNNFVNSLHVVNTKKDYPIEETTKKKLTSQIFVNTIKVSDIEKLSSYVKQFSSKYKN